MDEFDKNNKTTTHGVSSTTKRVCEVTSERRKHGAAMIDSSTTVVYYCYDLWSFDFDTLTVERVDDVPVEDFLARFDQGEERKGRDSHSEHGPGKR